MLLRQSTFILLTALLMFNSCKKSGNSASPTVYSAGYWGNGNYSVAAYWVNSRLFSLTDTTHDAVAVAICAAGNDVYVAGTVGSMTNGLSNMATWWKNGQAFQLGTTGASAATAIAVSAGNVYVAGEDRSYPVYWRNGEEVMLQGGYPSSYAMSIAVSGNDVYVVGMDSVKNPCYWKNGQLMELPGLFTQASAIAVSGNDVYVAGQQVDTVSGNWAAILWTNGTPSILSAPPYGANAGAIAIDGADVYIGGNVNLASAAWENGQLIPMPATPSYKLYTWSIGVANGKAYVGGNALSLGTNWTSEAAYWSADGLVILDKDPDQASNVWGIFVQ